MVVPRDGKGVRGVEGLLRYRGVEAWKEWSQAHHPFGQEAVEECALREGKNYLGTCILGYTEIWPHTLCTIKSSQYKVCWSHSQSAMDLESDQIPTCLGADFRDECQGVLAGVVHPYHLLSALGSLLTLLHHLVLVASRVDHRQKVGLQVVLHLGVEEGRRWES